MNIILLSGGSGKRLWPLSNGIESKQFIKLMKNEHGNYESMLQRTYRQIIKTDPNANILIAASSIQTPIIYEQIGKNINVCQEPMRKDTFPAITLAAVYMKDILKIDETETVVVCPVDSYVEDDYYKMILKLEMYVKEGEKNITLFGIEPTYSSEKYGYIIPEQYMEISNVKEFKEKPNRQLAEEYIRQGALWNAGVFAFKLGWFLQKAHNMIDFTNYQDLRKKYESLKPISFDYAIVEKEPSMQVIRYMEKWKDIGTWNALVEIMADSIKGNVICDESIKDTKIINGLPMPIVALGLKNLIIVSSDNGILISDKEHLDGLKTYVEKINKSF